MNLLNRIKQEIRRRRFIKRKLAELEDKTFLERVHNHNYQFEVSTFPNSLIMNERRENINR